ncbi:hypothetical protein SAMN04487916_10932 [Arthrobacter sp. ov407]|jgi:hypothetical protein|nr:hypothetical protein SAMN04487916_10932 [Arthrobacter sp. ov407]
MGTTTRVSVKARRTGGHPGANAAKILIPIAASGKIATQVIAALTWTDAIPTVR